VSLVNPAAFGSPTSSMAQPPVRIELPDDVSVDGLKRLRRAFGDGRAARCHPDRTDAADAGVVEPLTEREMQVLGLMAAGSSNQEIADEGSWSSTPSRSTSATSSTSSARPTAPRPSREHGS
jgi:Bacterial regulatory proteins, luxR family